MANGLTIQPNGQILVCTAGPATTFYTDTGLTSVVTYPTTITAATVWYCSPTNAVAQSLTFTTLDGTVVWNSSIKVGQTTDTFIRPQPTLGQLAQDMSVLNNQFTSEGGDIHSPFPRWACSSTNTLSNQSVRLSFYTAPDDMTVTSVVTYTHTTAAAATPTLCRIGLYTVAANGDITLAASTANDTALWGTISTKYSKALSTPYAVTAGSRYAIGLLCVTGATAPIVSAAVTSSSALADRSPRLAASVGSQADLPASVVNASLTVSGSAIYFELV